MKLVIYGMPERDAAALSVLVSKEFPGWVSEAHAAASPWTLAAADAYVLDMAGMGAPRSTEPLCTALREAVQSRPALLATMTHDTSWAECALTHARDAKIQTIRKPYGAQAMRDALRSVLPKRVVVAPVAAPVPAAPVETVVPVPVHRPARAPFQPTVLARARPAPVSDEVSTLSVQEFQQWVAGFSLDTRHVFFRKLAPALGGGKPFEICLTLQHSVVVFPDENWVATNTPMAVILRLCKSDALASVASIRAVDPDTVMRRVGGLGMNIEPLEPFLWNLHVQADAPPMAQRHS